QSELLQKPVVKRAMHLEFERADGVRNAFNVVAEAMRKVVHRVDAPLATSMVVFCMADSVENGVSHPDVGRSHVNFGAQGAGAVRKFAFFIRTNRSRFSSTERVRKGLSLPGLSGAPRYLSVSSGERSST